MIGLVMGIFVFGIWIAEEGPVRASFVVYECLIKVVWPEPSLLTLFGITL